MTTLFFLQMIRVSFVVGISVIILTVTSRAWEKHHFSISRRKVLWIILALLLLLGPFLPLPEGILSVPISVNTISLPAQDAIDAAEREPGGANAHPSTELPAVSQSCPTTDVPSLTQDPEVKVSPQLDLLSLGKWLWILGAVCFLLWITYREFLLYRKLKKKKKPVSDTELLAIYHEICGENNGVPPMFICSDLSTPMLAGLIHPHLFIPEKINISDAKYIFRHELTHWKNHDLWSKLMALLANAIHWWNPLVWLLRFQLNRDIEWACDELVLTNATLEEKRAYGATLLSIAERRFGALNTTFSKEAKSMKRRLQNILTGKRRSGILLVVFSVAAVAGLLTLVKFAIPEGPNTASPEVSNTETLPNDTTIKNTSILLIGKDQGTSMDVIMLAEFNAETPALNITSFPRDTEVEFTSSTTRLGSLYALAGGGDAGLEAMQDCVAAIVGKPVDDVVMIDLDGFVALVDAIDGVSIDVPIDMDYDDPYQNLSIHLSKGEQQLNGEQSAALIRFRRGNDIFSGYEDGDTGRISTQHIFLRALISKLLQSTDITHIPELASIFAKNVTSTLGIDDCIDLFKMAIEQQLTIQSVNFNVF